MKPILGLNWPGGPADTAPPLDRFSIVKSAGFAALRFDADCRRTDTEQWVDACLEVGLEPCPITTGQRAPLDVDGIAGHAARLADLGCACIFIENEPSIAPGGEPALTPEQYATLVKATWQAVGGRAQLILGAEMTIPVARPVPFYDEVVERLELHEWDVLDVHPYHEPHTEDSSPDPDAPTWIPRFLRDRCFRQSREEEHRRYVDSAKGKPIWWGETGSNLQHESEEAQARRYERILYWAETLEIPRVYFYTHEQGPEGTPDFGLWTRDWSQERLAVNVVREWLQRA
jgi:hypothetical protein